MTHEKSVSLNVHELGVILSALQLLSSRDENLIAKEHGSASTLHNRLKEVYDNMDQSTLSLLMTVNLPTEMNDQDIEMFIKAFDDFMQHS